MAKDASHCLYKAVLLPSMKDKAYIVLCAASLAFKKVELVKCSCPAGECQTCVHLSAMLALHALECLFEVPYKGVLVGTTVGEPKTSFECMWVKPRKKKVPATPAHTLCYVKHEYGKIRERKSKDTNFDPRPPSKRSTVTMKAGKHILKVGFKNSGTCAEILLLD